VKPLQELTERMEDYLRVIYEIERSKGYVRLKDVALRLNVKPSTALEMLKKLQSKGLIVHERYGYARLTEKGRRIAKMVEKRYNAIKKFLEIILVPPEIARRDAHILEHRLHPKTIMQIVRFVEFVENYKEKPRSISLWFKRFEKYCEKQNLE
jgi:DtxR family Mn-dependent transcriptional regulator